MKWTASTIPIPIPACNGGRLCGPRSKASVRTNCGASASSHSNSRCRCEWILKRDLLSAFEESNSRYLAGVFVSIESIHFRMLKRLKRDIRRRRSVSAWITVEGSFADRECRLIDISTNGAMLMLDWQTEVPNRFMLNRIPNSLPMACDVVWRRGRTVGVKFVR